MSTDTSVPFRLDAWVRGHVQGVGFRWWVRCRARELRLVGEARNLRDGRVAVTAEGDRRSCERLLTLLRGTSPPGRVDEVEVQWSDAIGGFDRFVER